MGLENHLWITYDNWQRHINRIHHRVYLSIINNMLVGTNAFVQKCILKPHIIIFENPTSIFLANSEKVLYEALGSRLSTNTLLERIHRRSANVAFSSDKIDILPLPPRVPDDGGRAKLKGKWVATELEMLRFSGANVGTIRGNEEYIENIKRIFDVDGERRVLITGDYGTYGQMQRYASVITLGTGKMPFFLPCPGVFHMLEMHGCEAIAKLFWDHGLVHFKVLLHRGRANANCSDNGLRDTA